MTNALQIVHKHRLRHHKHTRSVRARCTEHNIYYEWCRIRGQRARIFRTPNTSLSAIKRSFSDQFQQKEKNEKEKDEIDRRDSVRMHTECSYAQNRIAQRPGTDLIIIMDESVSNIYIVFLIFSVWKIIVCNPCCTYHFQWQMSTSWSPLARYFLISYSFYSPVSAFLASA